MSFQFHCNCNFVLKLVKFKSWSLSILLSIHYVYVEMLGKGQVWPDMNLIWENVIWNRSSSALTWMSLNPKFSFEACVALDRAQFTLLWDRSGWSEISKNTRKTTKPQKKHNRNEVRFRLNLKSHILVQVKGSGQTEHNQWNLNLYEAFIELKRSYVSGSPLQNTVLVS